LDGIAKGDQAQINKYIADCLAVKERYPKWPYLFGRFPKSHPKMARSPTQNIIW
jgi:hypothetical protein